MVAGERDDRRRIIAVGFIKLIVIILSLAEAVDGIAKMKEEQRLVHFIVAEVADHLIRNQVLIPWATGVSGIAGGMKHELAFLLDQTIYGVRTCTQYIGERQPRLGQIARRRKRQRFELVRRVELINLLIGRIVGGMPDFELGGVRRRLRLGEERMTDIGRARIIDRRSLGCRFWPARLRSACHANSSKSACEERRSAAS